MFSEEKVTHMASYILLKKSGGMSKIKLLKLLYLSEREYLAKFGESMSGDEFVLMPHGLFMSSTYKIIFNGGYTWESFIFSKETNEVSLKNNITEELLDELSISEIEILDLIINDFGSFNESEIVDYIHNNCKEFEKYNGLTQFIPHTDILSAIGVSKKDSINLIEHGKEQKSLTNNKIILL
jgi:uncharacterized phage-associated protein